MAKQRNQRRANKTGEYASKFEHEVADSLNRQGIKFEYELHSFKWVEKVPNTYCEHCGLKPCVADRSYTPDFFVFNENGKLDYIIEVKGIFTAKDRKIAEAMKATYPATSFRYLFYYNNKLSRSSKTRYSMWCDKKGLDYGMRADLDEVLRRWAV